MVAWKPDPEFWSATRAERAFVEGYELVAFDIPPGAGGPQRVIGWEVWSPKLPGLGSPEEYASAFLGYTVPKSRGREKNLNDIRHRQSSDEKRWAERMERIGLEPRGLEKGLSASFEEAKQAAETTLMKLIAIDVGLPLSARNRALCAMRRQLTLSCG